MTKSGGFDADAFYDALDGARRNRHLKWKDVAAEAGVSASTLTRMKQGKRPDVDSMAALAAWAKLDVDTFIRHTDEAGEQDAMPQISALLRADPQLDQASAKAIEELIQLAYTNLARGA